MRVGLTYDLRSDYLQAGLTELETAEFDRDDTIDYLEKSLRPLSGDVVRIGNARDLIRHLAAGETWDLVFNIAEGLAGVSREAQVPAILEVYGIAYTFSDPLVSALTLDKALTKAVVREAGIPTPKFAVIRENKEIDSLALQYPLFAKPVAEGTGKGVTLKSRVEDRNALERICQQLLEEFKQPVLVEEFLPGREFTVGLLGTGEEARAIGTLEIILLKDAEQGVYSFHNKEFCERLVEYRLMHAADDPAVREAERIALAAWRHLNCRDGGRVDIRCDAKGQPNFLEVNPLAGLHPEHSDLPMLATKIGMPYDELIREIVESATRRKYSEPTSLAQKLSQRLRGK